MKMFEALQFAIDTGKKIKYHSWTGNDHIRFNKSTQTFRTSADTRYTIDDKECLYFGEWEIYNPPLTFADINEGASFKLDGERMIKIPLSFGFTAMSEYGRGYKIKGTEIVDA